MNSLIVVNGAVDLRFTAADNVLPVDYLEAANEVGNWLLETAHHRSRGWTWPVQFPRLEPRRLRTPTVKHRWGGDDRLRFLLSIEQKRSTEHAFAPTAWTVGQHVVEMERRSALGPLSASVRRP